ncbi:MAG: hypothetical protein L3J43_11590 [Sulfurovum sp.]|nr:hypothetical protein [Sulfurovum sp.]
MNYYQTKVTEMERRELLLKQTMIKDKFSKTNFIFIFKEHNKTVRDEFNKVNKISFTKNVEINIKIISFNRIIKIKGGASLKTNNDSFGAAEDFAKMRGYMGIWDRKNKDFYVDKKGMFQSKGDW